MTPFYPSKAPQNEVALLSTKKNLHNEMTPFNT